MKLTILSAIAITGLATGAFGQSIILDNGANTGGVSATSGGLVYINLGGGAQLFDGYNNNLGVTVLGGSSSGSLTSMGTFTPGTDSKGYTGLDIGKFQLGGVGATVAVPGVAAGGVATIELQVWNYDGPGHTGTFADYASALAGLDQVAQFTFTQGTSNAGASPPVPASDLTGMPSFTLVAQVPEPATMALAGLGIASLLAFRRRS